MARDDVLAPDGSPRHFTAAAAASYLRHCGVGQHYRTQGDLWAIPDATRAIGLLELILEAIYKLGVDAPDPLARHSEYLRTCFDDDTKLTRKTRYQISRVVKMCHGINMLDVHSLYPVDDDTIHRLATSYQDNYELYRRTRKRLLRTWESLVCIKTIDQLLSINGFTKRRLEKLKQAIAVKDLAKRMPGAQSP